MWDSTTPRFITLDVKSTMPQIKRKFADQGINAVPTNVAGFNSFVTGQVAVLGSAAKGAGARQRVTTFKYDQRRVR